MIFRRTLGSKGQLVIPKDLREHLGLKAGSRVVFEVRGDIVILKSDTDPSEWVERFVSVVKKKLREEVDIERVVEEEVLEELAVHR